MHEMKVKPGKKEIENVLYLLIFSIDFSCLFVGFRFVLQVQGISHILPIFFVFCFPLFQTAGRYFNIKTREFPNF